jgi:hypothetical protein
VEREGGAGCWLAGASCVRVCRVVVVVVVAAAAAAVVVVMVVVVRGCAPGMSGVPFGQSFPPSILLDNLTQTSMPGHP